MGVGTDTTRVNTEFKIKNVIRIGIIFAVFDDRNPLWDEVAVHLCSPLSPDDIAGGFARGSRFEHWK